MTWCQQQKKIFSEQGGLERKLERAGLVDWDIQGGPNLDGHCHEEY